MFWVYKCNSRNLPYQRAYGDWEEVFRGRRKIWGSTEWTPEIRDKIKPGDVLIAYQTDRNELVGLVRATGWIRRGGGESLVVKPIKRIGVKVRPLKRANPAIAAIPAFKPGPIRTLYAISEEDARRLLKAAGVGVPKSSSAPKSEQRNEGGAGFGTREENQKVERAAMSLVRRYFETRGWSVDDVSDRKLGYDLLCKRRGSEAHVEVKGVAGTRPEFVITRNEREAWKRDRTFVLAVVTEALTRPRVRLFPGRRSLQRFRFKALSYSAKLVDGR